MRCAARASVHDPREMRRPGGRLPRLGPCSMPTQSRTGRSSFRAVNASQAHCTGLDPDCGLGREAIVTAGRRPVGCATAGLQGRRLNVGQFSFPAATCPLLRGQLASALDGCAMRPSRPLYAAATAAARGTLGGCSLHRLLECTGACRRWKPPTLRIILARPPRARLGDGAMPGIGGIAHKAPPRAAPAVRSDPYEPGAAGGPALCAGGDRVVGP